MSNITGYKESTLSFTKFTLIRPGGGERRLLNKTTASLLKDKTLLQQLILNVSDYEAPVFES